MSFKKTIMIHSVTELKALRKQLDPNAKVGFVPTMGNLHVGHQSLLARSVQENDLTMLSIFVNPSQFNDPNDYQRYPKTLDADITLATQMGVDYIFIPDKTMMYPDDYAYRISEQYISEILEGEHRPGHFTGMLTIVLKLFLLVRPERAYFGEKDYQQLQLVKGMVEAFLLDIEIVSCSTIRRDDGLALSSRNNLLTQEQDQLAQQFAQILAASKSPQVIKSQLENIGIKVEYVEHWHNRLLAAVKIGNIRLIDNVALEG